MPSLPGQEGTNCYTIASAQLSDAGQYFAVTRSTGGEESYTSSVATLSVLAPPTITSPPQSQTAVSGSGVVFSCGAEGAEPLSYQWLFNGSALGEKSSSVLKLTGVQASDCGAYSVVVTNVVGAVTSAPAVLNVIAPMEVHLSPALALNGEAGTTLDLEFADEPAPPDWRLLGSVLLTTPDQVFLDALTPLPSQRFYRGRQTNGVTRTPALEMNLVPAITLSGPIGSSFRIDYINQFGPIDAWQTLATVTLTNTAQVYVDVSAVRQPPRLYRAIQTTKAVFRMRCVGLPQRF